MLKDVRNELLSPAKAAADYGVDHRHHALESWTRRRPGGARAEIAERRGWREPPTVQRHDPLPVEPAAE